MQYPIITNVIPKETPTHFYFGSYSYNESTNQCVIDPNGIELWVEKENLNRLITPLLGIFIGSKPYVWGTKGGKMIALFEDKFCIGDTTEIHDWAANL